jgi:hypothetical protein
MTQMFQGASSMLGVNICDEPAIRQPAVPTRYKPPLILR